MPIYCTHPVALVRSNCQDIVQRWLRLIQLHHQSTNQPCAMAFIDLLLPKTHLVPVFCSTLVNKVEIRVQGKAFIVHYIASDTNLTYLVQAHRYK